MTAFSLSDLEAIVAKRAKATPDQSWTAKLVAGGQNKAAKKLGEEAIEAVMAAVQNDRENLVYESADLLYHLMVVLKIADIPLQDVMQELERRTAQTGLNEKASRQDP
ncbi:Phosphoribosyl-ATP pyrophosphatase [Rhizobium sp. PDO1-076]|uniref:phosphoribosyl-ATP diphosphatase n=1 Tax=Rhizobium sp. PDO1-076 TaxID=1125979 RepID=UPI00024E347A|nr:phosphoribosyl-ATP diphosphatase [Rhizobium sp. PDO1-076]EHS50313.1 Phosphoribosyl-ATP pyrophosphatase [Rhizobium sp. PDO1-076]